ncbi:transglycosylase SLT domain-containing protein [Photobacterium sp. SDRW27]|uniref:transglycosylase SLT domain-containing protein n=1 Tax=Photobacterium obscurum TaxID=2829490 RepID=UPI0022435515|nr:transglycosylase SLT domain-containing protein [Photobacterium obscurum]MCW8327953.1 transglycosylase SLT domain-containing protein [Photobacterium obscurum]
MKYVIILLATFFISGYQKINHIEGSDEFIVEELTYIDIPVDTIHQQCNIEQDTYKGRDISARGGEESINSVNTKNSKPKALDLWDIIGQSLSMPVPNNKRVNHYKNRYLSDSFHIATVTSRAENFLYYIHQKVKHRKMPAELVLLPFIESSFDPLAHSNQGASGLWQFTIPTGKAFGLKYLKGYDGRRDIIASTDAALDFLAYLYKKFKGNWLHAIAAYNSGEGRVRNAIKENKAKGKPIDFWSLQLPEETRQYVPKLLAIADLVKHRYDYNLSLTYIKPEPVLTEIIINHRVKLKLLANHAGLSNDELYSLNPGYINGYTFHSRENRILVPTNTKEVLYEYITSSDYVEKQFTIHHIQPGETLSELAYLNNTTVSLIKNANNLSGSIIFAGQQLRIPVR